MKRLTLKLNGSMNKFSILFFKLVVGSVVFVLKQSIEDSLLVHTIQLHTSLTRHTINIMWGVKRKLMYKNVTYKTVFHSYVTLYFTYIHTAVCNCLKLGYLLQSWTDNLGPVWKLLIVWARFTKL